jgi:hypothetical protein
MKNTTPFVTKIISLLKKNIVMSLQQLRQALNERPSSSLYRDFKKVPLITSCSHSGQYHALKSSARFDQHDLWFFKDICFSSHGTLKATLVFMITHAEAGMTPSELKNRLRVNVQNRLAELLKSELVERTLLPQQRYLYVSKVKVKATAQLQNRLVLQARDTSIPLPAENIQIDILLAVIRSVHQKPDEAMLAVQFKKESVNIDERDILSVFSHYDLKKTDHDISLLIGHKTEQQKRSMEARFLFPRQPELHFSPLTTTCQCGAKLAVLKTTKKTVATLPIGQFKALETHMACPQCDVIYRSQALRKLTPHHGQFGFDVIEYIGKALFVDCLNESAIQADLAVKNIAISTSEIAFLGKRFILYLALAHKQSSEDLKDYMSSKGGYILHLDGTCEGDSPNLFSCIDGVSDIVLGNKKMPSEDSKHIIPLLQQFKSNYGHPIALVHDTGTSILKSVKTVFPTVPDYICHFHFLRDIGKDLFETEYGSIRRNIRAFKVKPALKKAEKALKIRIDDDKALSAELATYLNENQAPDLQAALNPVVTAYLLVTWILGACSE